MCFSTNEHQDVLRFECVKPVAMVVRNAFHHISSEVQTPLHPGSVPNKDVTINVCMTVTKSEHKGSAGHLGGCKWWCVSDIYLWSDRPRRVLQQNVSRAVVLLEKWMWFLLTLFHCQIQEGSSLTTTLLTWNTNQQKYNPSQGLANLDTVGWIFIPFSEPLMGAVVRRKIVSAGDKYQS